MTKSYLKLYLRGCVALKSTFFPDSSLTEERSHLQMRKANLCLRRSAEDSRGCLAAICGMNACPGKASRHAPHSPESRQNPSTFKKLWEPALTKALGGCGGGIGMNEWSLELRRQEVVDEPEVQRVVGVVPDLIDLPQRTDPAPPMQQSRLRLLLIRS